MINFSCSLADVKIGPSYPVRIVGVLNVSPESFYQGSVRLTRRGLADAARRLEQEGADLLDVGAMSTAPYLKTQISEQAEATRLGKAVEAIRRACQLPISIDTSRFEPARAGLDAGASILNDITGLREDPRLLGLLPHFRGLILMAHPMRKTSRSAQPIKLVSQLLRQSLSRAMAAGVRQDRIVIDPGIGFFRKSGMLWWKWDLLVLRNLAELNKLKAPVLVGVSRKSFIGEVLGLKDPAARLAGSLAATALAVENGASLIRTHDVKATREAVRMAELLMRR